MNQNLSPKAIISIVIVFSLVLGLRIYADGRALDFHGPDHMHLDPQGRLYIQIANQIQIYDRRGDLMRQVHLADIGIDNLQGDFAVFTNGDILLYRALQTSGKQASLDAPGLYRCQPALKTCTRFDDGSIQLSRTFHLAIDALTEDVFVADTNNHAIHKFNKRGERLATKERGFIFPNQLLPDGAALYIADTNHHQIQRVQAGTDDFGSAIEKFRTYSNNEEVMQKDIQKFKLGQIWPATFARIHGNWWINNMTNGMNEGGIYIFNRDWQLTRVLDLPVDADPLDLAFYGDRVLISDLNLNRVYQFSTDGQQLEDFSPAALQAILDDNRQQQAFYTNVSRAALASFAVLLIAGFAAGIGQARQAAKTAPLRPSRISASPKPASDGESTPLPLQFTGTAMEYFGIWIVNILLILLTFGIYTAWAKVRTNRYFYRNTLLDGSPFDYLADPLAILKGWLIAMVIFIAYSFASTLLPLLQILFALLIFFLLPVLVVKAMAFRLYNSSYRNLRFTFEKDYGGAFRNFVLFALALPFTLFLMIPSYVYRQRKFLVNNSGYGCSRFDFNGPEIKFYEIFGIGLLILIAGSVVVSLISAALIANGNFPPATELLPGFAAASGKSLPLASMLAMTAGWVASYLFFFAYVNTQLYNLIWNSSNIAGHTFRSTLKVRSMAWLYFSNGLAIILSAGLLVPWARIRMARYKINHLTLLPCGDLGKFIAGETRHVSAAGDQVGEVFDVDIGF